MPISNVNLACLVSNAQGPSPSKCTASNGADRALPIAQMSNGRPPAGISPSPPEIQARLLEEVYAREAMLLAKPGQQVSCSAFPRPTGTSKIVIEPRPALDALLLRAKGNHVAITNAVADSTPGGHAAIEHLGSRQGPLETALYAVSRGGFASVLKLGNRGLGTRHASEDQVHSTATLRYKDKETARILAVTAEGHADRLAAQLEVMLEEGVPKGSPSGNPFGLITLNIPSRRELGNLDPIALHDSVLRQLGHAMVKANSDGVEQFIVSLPVDARYPLGSGQPDAKLDVDYLAPIARAVAEAAQWFGKAGMQVVIPSHGREFDVLLRTHAAGVKPPVPAKPVVRAELEAARMRNIVYRVEKERFLLAPDSPASQALKPWIDDGSDLRLYRAHDIDPPEGCNAPYLFMRRDAQDIGRVLMYLEESPGKYDVFEARYSPLELFSFSEMVSRLP